MRETGKLEVGMELSQVLALMDTQELIIGKMTFVI
jgi:hypothetical protein